MKVILSAEARRDLGEIGDYIAQDNPRRARSFVRELVAKARGIGEAPHGSEFVARYRDLGIRWRPFGAYLIFYRVEPHYVWIIRILHGSRDYEAVLFPDSQPDR